MTQATPPPATTETTTEYTISYQRWLERFMRTVLRAAVVLGAVLVLAAFVAGNPPVLTIAYVVIYIAVLLAAFIPFSYRFRAGLLLFAVFGVGAAGVIERGAFGDARIYFPIFIIAAVMLFGRRATLPAILLICLTGIGFGIPILTGKLPLLRSDMAIGSVASWVVAYVNIVIVALLVTTGWTFLQDEFERAQQSAVKAFKELTQERAELDLRVQERTAELSATSELMQQRANRLNLVAEVAHQISLVQNMEELLPTVTRLLSERFGLYHVGIFLINESLEYAVLQAANSEGGQRMLKRGHKLKVGQTSIVGYVTATNKPRIALTVGTDAVFFNNPDLPETRSEMALPLTIGERVIGALDVQSTQESAFKEEDLEVMHILADEVAIAIENTRLISETRQSLTEVQSLYGQYLRQKWSQLSIETQKKGYRRTPEGIEPLSEIINRPEIRNAVDTGKVVSTEGKTQTLTIPLKLRDEVIGVLDIRSTTATWQWTENELAVVQAVADRVALALENARLFEETTRRADRERTVADITTKIRATTDPQTMLATTIEELKKTLGTSDIQIRPYTTQPTNQPARISGAPKKKARKTAK